MYSSVVGVVCRLQCSVWKPVFFFFPGLLASVPGFDSIRVAGVVLAGRCQRRRRRRSSSQSVARSTGLSCRCFNCVQNARAACLGCSCRKTRAMARRISAAAGARQWARPRRWKQGTGLAKAWNLGRRSRYDGSPEIGRLDIWRIARLEFQ